MRRSGIGTVVPTYSVTVKARVDGQLDKVAFKEGEDVKKGQLLVQLDPRTLQAALMQAQATRAKDQATLANARVDLKRYETLIKQDAATRAIPVIALTADVLGTEQLRRQRATCLSRDPAGTEQQRCEKQSAGCANNDFSLAPYHFCFDAFSSRADVS